MNTIYNAQLMLNSLDRYVNTFEWGSLTKGKQVILECFLKIATREGISGTSMRNLASAAGLRPPTIYSHFPNGRDEIISAALRWHYNNFAKGLQLALRACSTAEEFWAELTRYHITQQLKRPENDMWDILVAMDNIVRELPDDLRAEVNDWEEFCDSMYESIAMDLGVEKKQRNTRVIRKLFDSVGSWWNWDGTDEHIEEAIRYALVLSYAILKI